MLELRDKVGGGPVPLPHHTHTELIRKQESWAAVIQVEVFLAPRLHPFYYIHLASRVESPSLVLPLPSFYDLHHQKTLYLSGLRVLI